LRCNGAVSATRGRTPLIEIGAPQANSRVTQYLYTFRDISVIGAGSPIMTFSAELNPLVE
jgi:hypothetical protein